MGDPTTMTGVRGNGEHAQVMYILYGKNDSWKQVISIFYELTNISTILKRNDFPVLTTHSMWGRFLCFSLVTQIFAETVFSPSSATYTLFSYLVLTVKKKRFTNSVFAGFSLRAEAYFPFLVS